MNKLPPATKLSSIKPGAIQLWAPLALEMAIRGEKVGLTPGQTKLLKDRHNLSRLATTEGSWNHQQMLWALALWLEEGCGPWWEAYLKCQLGDFDDVLKLPPQYLRQWGGSESNSAGYEHMRWGAVCAVELWARRQKTGSGGRDELLRLCKRYHKVQAAMSSALFTCVGERSGEHSEPLHLEMYKLITGWLLPKSRWTREIDWPMRLAMQVLGPSMDSGIGSFELLRPLFSEIRHAYWAIGESVSWMVERKNFNTPCYLIDRVGGDLGRTLVYPWTKGRGFSDKRPGGVMLTSDGLRWSIGKSSDEGDSGLVALPVGVPSFCYSVGQKGYVEGDWAAWLRGE